MAQIILRYNVMLDRRDIATEVASYEHEQEALEFIVDALQNADGILGSAPEYWIKKIWTLKT